VIVDADGRYYDGYDSFLRSPLWRGRRGAWLRKHGGFCRACGKRGLLDVHHLEYPPSLLGREPDECLTALCHGKRCHFTAHRYFESGAYESMRAATAAFIVDSRDHRRKVKARRSWVRRGLRRLLAPRVE